MVKKTAIIVGSGFGGLGAAALLGKAGYQVTVLEKNGEIGGRAGFLELPLPIKKMKPSTTATDTPRTGTPDKTQDSVHDQLVEPIEPFVKNEAETQPTQSAGNTTELFKFDTGPCWYIMPDVFENFFSLLDERIGDHLEFAQLKPSYRAFYKGQNLMVEMFSDLERDLPTIEALEPKAGKALKKYLSHAGRQYDTLQGNFMHKNRDSFLAHLTPNAVAYGEKLHPLLSMNKHVGDYFKSDVLQKLVQYPAIFLGLNPYTAPAVYSILNHLDFTKGVYYPLGGIAAVVKALQSIGAKHHVNYQLNSPVVKIVVEQGRAIGVKLESGEELRADIVISNADIHHTEQQLLEAQYRTKSEAYWRRRSLAPSALVMHLGVEGELPDLTHHNLLFAQSWQRNLTELFHYPQWPADPTLYICNPNKTDPTVAPAGYESLSIMVPLAAKLDYNKRILEAYADKVLGNVEQAMRLKDLRKRIVAKQLFCIKDFEERYNSYGGSAFGLAHTLRQNTMLNVRNSNKKVKNLYYVGDGASPGIGLPGTLISAELMFKRLINDTTAKPLQPKQVTIS